LTDISVLEKLSQIENNLSILASEKRSLLDELTKLRRELNQSRSELDSRLEEMTRLHRDINKLERRKLKVENNIKFYSDLISTLEKELNFLQSDYDLTDLNAQIRKIRGKIRRLEEKYEEQELTRIEEKEVTRQIAKLEERLKQLKESRRKIFRRAKIESNIERFKNRIKELENEIKKLEEESAKLRSELKELEKTSVQLQLKINNLVSELENLKYKLNQVNNKRENLLREKREIMVSLGIETDDNIPLKAIQEYIQKRKYSAIQGQKKIKESKSLTFEEFKALVEEGLL